MPYRGASQRGFPEVDRLAAQPYDLVVCDLVMPTVDGRAVYRAVQERPRPRPRVLFLSGYYDAGGHEDFLRETGAATMPKPFEINALRGTVRRLLEMPAGG
jgi:two-component system cell cycle sensor histidine kinase/response regulator CckA